MQRRPDGQPEYRGPDDLLREALSDEEWAKLPGKGKRLDLRSYFQSGEDTRLANKILNDNGVLPQHLTDRKEVERLRSEAEEHFTRNLDALADIRDELRGAVKKMIAPFDSLATFCSITQIEGWPDDFPSPQGAAWPSRALVKRHASLVLDLQTQHSALVSRALECVETDLTQANQVVERLRKNLIRDERVIPNYPIPQPADVEGRIAESRDRIPPIPGFPPDLEQRLLHTRPQWTWKTWRSAGTATSVQSSRDSPQSVRGRRPLPP